MGRRVVDWYRTGAKLQMLRNDDLELRRYVCHELNYARGNCSGNCAECLFDMDRMISRRELGLVFNVSENVITNWERGLTPIDVENLLFYCEIAKKEISDILVFA